MIIRNARLSDNLDTNKLDHLIGDPGLLDEEKRVRDAASGNNDEFILACFQFPEDCYLPDGSFKPGRAYSIRDTDFVGAVHFSVFNDKTIQIDYLGVNEQFQQDFFEHFAEIISRAASQYPEHAIDFNVEVTELTRPLIKAAKESGFTGNVEQDDPDKPYIIKFGNPSPLIAHSQHQQSVDRDKSL